MKIYSEEHIQKFKAYIDKIGGNKAAAKEWGCALNTILCYRCGHRPIRKDIAKTVGIPFMGRTARYIKPRTERQEFLIAYVKSVGGAVNAGEILGYSDESIANYMYGKNIIPRDICSAIGIEFIQRDNRQWTEQTYELQKYIDYIGGKKTAAKRLQISLTHLNQMLNNSLRSGVITPIIAERAELDSDGYVSKVKMIFAAPSIYHGN